MTERKVHVTIEKNLPSPALEDDQRVLMATSRGGSMYSLMNQIMKNKSKYDN